MRAMKEKYITTSIAYVNADPHIGFLFELLSADILNRAYKQAGEKSFFLTGTDEHGQKVAKAAKATGVEPQEYVDKVSASFNSLGKDFNIDFDYFIRTTNPEHKQFVQEQWKKLAATGYLEKRKYTGLYCNGCEAFKTEKELKDNKCLIHETPVEVIEEENWFFKLSQFAKPLLKWLDTDPITPKNRANEVREFIKSGLEDISFSRHLSKLSWGVPVPGDDEQVMYVWADALLNYLSGPLVAGKKLEEVWPADIQIVGKDILRFHAVIWPAILIALGYDLPKKLIVHGFINSDGKKMSKSLGNVISPKQLLERYGVDGTRYLLFRQLSYYDDSNFVWSEVDSLYNGELANGIGNLVARSISLLKGFKEAGIEVEKLVESSLQEKTEKNTLLETLDFSSPLIDVNQLVNLADTWITKNQPWTWRKTGEITQDKVAEFLGAVKLGEIANRLEPYTPETSKKIVDQLKALTPEPLFPRLA
jgi:methionyl-tRNA synthetase